MDEWKELQQSVGDFFTPDKEDDSGFIRYGQVPMSTRPVVEFLVDYKDKQSKFVGAELQKACDYTKIPFHATSIKSWSANPKFASTVRTIVVFDTKKLSNTAIAKLTDFVAAGGTLFIPFASEDRRMGFLYGYKPDADFDTDSKSAGWYFSTPVLPTLKGKTLFPTQIHYGFARKNFTNNIRVLSTAANNPYYPSILENPVGKGKVLLYNTTTLYIKQDRGFLFAGMLKGLEGIPYPVANTSTIFLDDFPSPLYDIRAEPVESEFHLMMSDYVQQIWWPDMQKLAKEFNIKYSAMIAFDYKNKVYPPFVFDQWNTKKIKLRNRVEPMSDWLVRDVEKKGHELSLHGYNHVELTTALWKNQEFIGTAFKAVQKKWDASNFGAMPATYVPPSNYIDAKGTVALTKGMPSIKYMCSLFLGEMHEGGNREFDYEPYNRELFDFPRTACGFYMNEEEEYALHSIFLFTGIWNHFVHPDDVFQIPATANSSAGHFDLRNRLNYGWRKTKGGDKAMFPEFRRYLRLMNTNFPQLRYLSGGEGAKTTIKWRASRYSHSAESGLYTVDQLGNGTDKEYWFMYGSQANAPRLEAMLKRQASLYAKTPFMDGYLYSAYTTKPTLTSVDLRYKTPEQRRAAVEAIRTVRAGYFKYLDDVKKYISGALATERENKKAEADLAALKDRILNTAAIDSVSWNKYAKLMSWEDKGDEIWKMYEDHIKKYPTANNIMYSKELDRVIGYPNDVLREKWIWAQIEIDPTDTALLKTYISDFDTEENRLKIRDALIKLYKQEATPANYKEYLSHLLQYYPEEARAELDKRVPSAEFDDLTDNIVWLYADNNDFKKAYEWSKFTKSIDFGTKMSWLVELKDYVELEKEYNKYIVENPNDFAAKAQMAWVFHETGRFRESWVLANSLPESDEKEELRKALNIDVVFESESLQIDLATNESELFYPNVRASIIRQNRIDLGNFVDTDSRLETNQKNPAIFKNRASFNFFDKNRNLHSAGIVYSTYYHQDLNGDYYPDNFDNSVKGLEYKFTRAEREGKINYYSRARAELDDRNKAYYEFGAGADLNKNKKFTSAEFNIFPAETGPALNQGIYQMKLNLYREQYFFEKISASLALEGSYYTEGLLGIDTVFVDQPEEPENPEERVMPRFRRIFTTISDNAYTVVKTDEGIEGAATLRLAWDDGEERRSRIAPYVEGQYAVGSLDQSSGYPYWMIMRRLYGGAGANWAFKTETFSSKVDAGYFFDDYSGNFQRYIGNIEWRLFDYTLLTANFEFFSQDKYYSNSFQLGIKYNLPKKLRKQK